MLVLGMLAPATSAPHATASRSWFDELKSRSQFLAKQGAGSFAAARAISVRLARYSPPMPTVQPGRVSSAV